MRVGLVDVDGHNFPNLALMKISAWHKAQGDTVCFASSLDFYDKIYMAKVFTFTEDDLHCYQARELIRGGTGYNLNAFLPHEIESSYPDYSLYGITNTAYGFLTRGCPRKCPFCIVSQKEGVHSRKVADLNQFWNGQKNIKLLDPNLLASRDHIELLRQLANSNASNALVDFTQGLDARLLTEENVELINQCKIKMIHFAWDNPKDKKIKKHLINFLAKSKIKDFRKLRVYVLTNYWSSHKEDLERVYWLKENGYDPYMMIYDKAHAPKETRYLQRWVNNKQIFRVIEKFEEYDHKVG